MDKPLRQGVISYFIDKGEPVKKIAGALFPDLYIISDNMTDMKKDFNHLHLAEGDQFHSHYLHLRDLNKNKIQLPSVEYLLKYPMENWLELKNNIKIRRFLMLHAYYHFHHHQFWRHYKYLEKKRYFDQTDQLQKKDSVVLKKALLMAFHINKSDAKIREIYSLIIKYQSWFTRSDIMRIRLQYAVMLTHKQKYQSANIFFEELEEYFISQNTQMKIDYYNARALFYYKTGKYSIAMKDSYKALELTNEDPVNFIKIKTVILKNIQKLKGGQYIDR